MARRTPDLNPTEWRLMKVLWDRRAATVREVFDVVESDTGWAYTTVKTMLERMGEKGLLKVDRAGPVKQFRPRRSRRNLVSRSLERFLDLVLDGSLVPLVSYIAKTRGLSAREIRQLEGLLQGLDGER